MAATSLGQRLNYLLHEDAFRSNPIRVLARLAWWRGVTLVGRSPVRVHLPGYDISVLVPPEWRGIAKLIFAYRERYDRELIWLSKNVPIGSTTVDVGANLGIYSMVAAKAAGPHGTVLSFEPAANTFRFLKTNVALNGLANVQAFNCALGDREDNVPFYHHPDASRNSLGLGQGMSGTSESVHMTTLERICQQNRIGNVDIVKIDVEGAEETVLNGCRSVLERWNPQLIIELNSVRAAAMGLAPDGAWRTLLALRYRIYKLEVDGRLHAVESLPSGPANLIAIRTV